MARLVLYLTPSGVFVFSCITGATCCHGRGRGPLILIRALAGALIEFPVLVIVVSMPVIVYVTEHGHLLLLLLLFRANRTSVTGMVHYRVQGSRPLSGLHAPSAWGFARSIIDERVIVTAERATKSGPAAIDALQADVRTVQYGIAGRAVARSRAGVACRPVSKVTAALRVVTPNGAAAVVLAAMRGSATRQVMSCVVCCRCQMMHTRTRSVP